MRNCTPPRLLLWIRFCNYSNVKLSARLADSLSLAAIFYTFFLNLDSPFENANSSVFFLAMSRILELNPLYLSCQWKVNMKVKNAFQSFLLSLVQIWFKDYLTYLGPVFMKKTCPRKKGHPPWRWVKFSETLNEKKVNPFALTSSRDNSARGCCELYVKGAERDGKNDTHARG